MAQIDDPARLDDGPGEPIRLLRAHVAPSVRLAYDGSCAADADGIRFGGVPRTDEPWPRTDTGRALCFLGQLDTDELNAVLPAPAYPPGRLLGFFLDVDGPDGRPGDPGWADWLTGPDSWRVLDSPAGGPAAETPRGTTEYPAHRLRAAGAHTVPDAFERPMESVWRGGEPVDLLAVYALVESADPPPRHRVGGWPDLVRNGMQEECAFAAAGVEPPRYSFTRTDEHRAIAATADEWTLLWQIDSDVDWSWSVEGVGGADRVGDDAGTLYYWIRRADLAAGRFDRVRAIIQSG